jgi:hypothetical protein
MAALFVAIAMLSQADPGPLDAFEANYASMKAGLDFTYTCGGIDSGLVANARLWTLKQPNFVEVRERSVVGQWQCDGTAEYYNFCSPDDVVAEALKQAPEIGKRVAYVPHIESIYDGETRAAHVIDDQITADRGYVINVFHDGEPGLISLGKGPLLWWISYPFPKFLQVHFSGIAPKRFTGVCGGRPVEIEVYRKEQSQGWTQVEAFYDPAIGYLPRFASLISDLGNGTTSIKEIYVTEALPCAAGGFVPTEWYGLHFRIRGFKSRYPDYDAETALPPGTRVAIERFKGANLTSVSGPVGLTHLAGVHTLSTPGGRLPLKEGEASLTLKALKSKLGARLTNPSPRVLPHLDEAALGEFAQPAGHNVGIYLGPGLFAAVFAAFAWIFRKRLRHLVAPALLLITGTGCTRPDEPAVKLTGQLSPSQFLCDLNDRDFALSLLVRNEGNQRIRLLGASAGCSCRQVEQSRFPCDLSPGLELNLSVSMTNNRRSTPQNMLFSFQTSQGNVEVPVSLHVLMKHQFDPESFGRGSLTEGEDWNFEVLHRVVAPAGQNVGDFELRLPPGFEAKKVKSVGGAVAAAPEFQFFDTTYKISLVDFALGMRKDVVRIVDRDRRPVLEAPVVWQRVSYLSTSPERVVLGARPVRLFLRCPDESIELVQVLRVPIGIKAVISSVRELTVLPTEAAPAVINDFIEVGTTAPKSPPLRIPVVRYAPPPRRA